MPDRFFGKMKKNDPPRSDPVKCCSRCGESKPLDQFCPRKASKDGREPACRQCMRKSLSADAIERRQAYISSRYG